MDAGGGEKEGKIRKIKKEDYEMLKRSMHCDRRFTFFQHALMASSSSHAILEDEFVAQFAGASGQEAARFASACLRGENSGNGFFSAATLAHKTTQVEAALRGEVGLHQSSLLEQSSHLALLEDALATARDGVTRW
jgi:NAD(P)H-hydrate repair Nnr-like enzyme with NAD(P)H-hydrate epimerase domain